MTWEMRVFGHTDDTAEEAALMAFCEEVAKQMRVDYPNAVTGATFTGSRGNNASNLGYVSPLEDATKAELLDEAAKVDPPIEGAASMKKDELRTAVEEAQE